MYRHSDWRFKKSKAILQATYDSIQNELPGPLYVHCNFGNHASGAVAAYVLMQFCDFTHKDALQYWQKNIVLDGEYSRVKKEIKRFVADPELQISAEKKKLICINYIDK